MVCQIYLKYNLDEVKIKLLFIFLKKVKIDVKLVD